MDETKKHYCYLLKSTISNKTYFGYTVDPYKRLRQHNGEIVGGAKKTKKGRPWKLLCYIDGFPTHRSALQFEWKNNHPTKGYKIKGLTRGYLVDKKIKNLTIILAAPKWTGFSPDSSKIPLKVTWLSDHHLYWKELNIEIPEHVSEIRKLPK